MGSFPVETAKFMDQETKDNHSHGMIDPTKDMRSSFNRDKLGKIMAQLDTPGKDLAEIYDNILAMKLSPIELASLFESRFFILAFRATAMQSLLAQKPIGKVMSEFWSFAFKVRADKIKGAEVEDEVGKKFEETMGKLAGGRNKKGINQYSDIITVKAKKD